MGLELLQPLCHGVHAKEPRAWTRWSQHCRPTLLLSVHRKPCRSNPRRLHCLTSVERCHSGLETCACCQWQFTLLSLPKLGLQDKCPDPSPSLYLSLCVPAHNLLLFCRSPCSGSISVLQVGMTAAYQVGGFGLCVEFGERFCSKLLYFLACKPWEHMAHCLQNVDILKLGEE